MTNALKVYRATVSSAEDPEGLGRVLLSITRTVRGVTGQVEGWAHAGVAPLGDLAEIRPHYTAGDSVLYAAERLPFVCAIVLCRETNTNTNAPAQPLSFYFSLGPGNQMKIEASLEGTLRLSTTAGQQVSLHANGSIEAVSNEMLLRTGKLTVSAGLLSVEAGMAQFTGTVKCDTLIANSVVGASYTPGAGNIW